MIFEFTTGINSENLSPTKETKFLNSLLKSKLIKFSNFINHVMIYHEFRFISYIDESFSIEQKIKNTKHYKPIIIQNLNVSENERELQNPDILNFFTNVSSQFLNFVFEENPLLFMLFKNAQISSLDYSISVDSEKITYFVSLDKTYVVRFFDSNIFAYHIPSGKRLAFKWISWRLIVNPKKQLHFEPVTKFGEFLPSCYHPKVKQTVFKNKITNDEVIEHDKVSIKFQLNCKRGPNTRVDYCFCFADHVYMDLYL